MTNNTKITHIFFRIIKVVMLLNRLIIELMIIKGISNINQRKKLGFINYSSLRRKNTSNTIILIKFYINYFIIKNLKIIFNHYIMNLINFIKI